MPASPPSSVELLAPAGGLDAAYAAFSQGADAVYLGLRRFSARAEAANFAPEEAAEITAFAHAQPRRRRVFVTLNTLLAQAELRPVLDTLELLAGIGVDAVITQDLGLAALARRHWPQLELHASTQMAVHSLEGARELRRLGFARVTLARELTLDEIRAISAGAGLETEVFIHGALCYSYSGLCLFSSYRCGRSGNRGRCAYPCRDRFRILDGGPPGAPAEAFPFSMKDFAVPGRLDALRDTGAACWKIEGRMKAPLYVAATTAFYRRLRDGELRDPAARADAEAQLKSIFSRPWTDLFLAGRRRPGTVDPERVGHRGTPAGTVLAVRRDHQDTVLRLRLDRAVERHDGFQVEPAGADRPFGFAVDPLRLVPRAGGTPRDVFEAGPGATVEVPLPLDAPPIPAGATVFLSSSQAVRRAFTWTRPRPDDFRLRHPITVRLEAAPDRLSARATLVAAAAAGLPPVTAEAALDGPFETARQPGALAEAARKVFDRLGDTPFQLAGLEVQDPGGIFVPVSRFNALRRDLADALGRALDAATAARLQAVAAAEATVLMPVPPPTAPAATAAPARWSVLADDPAVLLAFPADGSDAPDEVQAPLAAWTPEALAQLVARFGAGRVRAALPPVARDWDADWLRDRIAAARALGIRRWLVANLAGFDWLRADAAPDDDLLADWTLPVANRAAARALADLGAAAVTLSPEDGRDNLAGLLAALRERAELPVYQDTPLFLAESCVYANLAGACPGPDRCGFRSMTLEHPKGGRFLARPEGCRTVLVADTPFCLGGRLDELARAGARRFRAEFAHRSYAPADALAVWRALRAGRALPNTHTANYLRGLA
ncbi:MAG: U32 family peptidase [Lentisphaeria bacterium]